MKKTNKKENKIENKVIGYLRVSTTKQELLNQKHSILEYCQVNKMICNEFIEVEISSRKTEKERKITELLSKLNSGDTLICVELSRLGRNMLELLSLINDLNKMNVKIIFIKQPELSTNNSTSNLLLSIYSYFCETERELISLRIKDSLKRLKSEGKILGRVKGGKNKHNVLNEFSSMIEKNMKLGLSLTNVLKLINSESNKKISYTQIDYFVKNNPQLNKLKK